MSSYTATRIQVMRTRLIKPEEYERILKMGEKEIIGYLQSTDYRPDIDALSLSDLDDLEAVDRIIARNTDRTVQKLQRISDKDFMGALSIFLRENDLWNLKVIAGAIASGSDAKETLKRYAKRGTVNPARYCGAKTIADLALMAGSAVPSLRSKPSTLAAFTDALAVDLSGHAAARFIIDEHNILKLLMLKREKISPEQIIRRLHRGGTVGIGALRNAAKAATFEDAVKALRSTKYGAAIGRAEGGKLTRLEFALHQDVLRRIRRSSGSYPLRAEVLVRYVIEKEIEGENLRLLIKGKRLGLEESFLREQLMT